MRSFSEAQLRKLLDSPDVLRDKGAFTAWMDVLTHEILGIHIKEEEARPVAPAPSSSSSRRAYNDGSSSEQMDVLTHEILGIRIKEEEARPLAPAPSSSSSRRAYNEGSSSDHLLSAVAMNRRESPILNLDVASIEQTTTLHDALQTDTGETEGLNGDYFRQLESAESNLEYDIPDLDECASVSASSMNSRSSSPSPSERSSLHSHHSRPVSPSPIVQLPSFTDAPVVQLPSFIDTESPVSPSPIVQLPSFIDAEGPADAVLSTPLIVAKRNVASSVCCEVDFSGSWRQSVPTQKQVTYMTFAPTKFESMQTADSLQIESTQHSKLKADSLSDNFENPRPSSYSHNIQGRADRNISDAYTEIYTDLDLSGPKPLCNSYRPRKEVTEDSSQFTDMRLSVDLSNMTFQVCNGHRFVIGSISYR